MKATKTTVAPATAFLLLVLLCCGVTQAFVPLSSLSISNKLEELGHPNTLALKKREDDNEEKSAQNHNENRTPEGVGVGRRGTLMTLLGGAASLAMGDVVLNSVVKTATSSAVGRAVVKAGGGLYERVLAFGKLRGGSAIASEELTTWIASQEVAATPEITAWLAAQRKLQVLRKSTVAATTLLSRAKNSKKVASTTAAAATGGGSILEEGLLTAAATSAVKRVFATSKNTDDNMANEINDNNVLKSDDASPVSNDKQREESLPLSSKGSASAALNDDDGGDDDSVAI